LGPASTVILTGSLILSSSGLVSVNAQDACNSSALLALYHTSPFAISAGASFVIVVAVAVSRTNLGVDRIDGGRLHVQALLKGSKIAFTCFENIGKKFG
jgi:hypothetical protein